MFVETAHPSKDRGSCQTPHYFPPRSQPPPPPADGPCYDGAAACGARRTRAAGAGSPTSTRWRCDWISRTLPHAI